MISSLRKIRSLMLRQKKFLNYLIYAIGEIALIVVGILLAVYLQNRNEERKITDTVQTTIDMLKDEILTNKSKIANVKDYHIMVRDTLKKIEMPKSEEAIHKTLSFLKGMRTPRLQDAAFQTSVQSGIGKEFDPVFLKVLNNLYTYQDSYNNFTAQSSQIFFSTDFTDLNNFNRLMASVGMIMNDLYWYERELTEMFDYSLKQIDSLYN